MENLLKKYEDHDFSAYFYNTLKYVEKGMRKEKFWMILNASFCYFALKCIEKAIYFYWATIQHNKYCKIRTYSWKIKIKRSRSITTWLNSHNPQMTHIGATWKLIHSVVSHLGHSWSRQDISPKPTTHYLHLRCREELEPHFRLGTNMIKESCLPAPFEITLDWWLWDPWHRPGCLTWCNALCKADVRCIQNWDQFRWG